MTIIRGDDSLQSTVYVREDNGLVTSDARLAFEGKTRSDVDPRSIAHLLRVGFIPYPRAVYSGIVALGPGDRLDDQAKQGVESSQPYLLERSRQDGVADTGILLSHLVDSVREGAKLGQRIVLFQSAGKDSSAIALALAEAGLQDSAVGVTFYNDLGSDEHELAAGISDRLGLRHEGVRIGADTTGLVAAYESYFSYSPFPNADQSLGPYVYAAMKYCDSSTVIFDGTGPDIYFGVPAPKWMHCLDAINYGGRLADWLAGALLSRRHLLRRVMMNRAEANIGAYVLSEREIAKLLPSAECDAGFWAGAACETRDLSLMDVRSSLKLKHQDPRQVMEKGRAASYVSGASDIWFPYAFGPLIDYVFHLNQTERYSSKYGPNKVILRRLLREELGYDDIAIGKRPFRFGSHGFLREQRDWVYREVVNSPLWGANQQRVGKILDELYNELPQPRTRSKNAILALFQICGWYNKRPL